MIKFKHLTAQEMMDQGTKSYLYLNTDTLKFSVAFLLIVLGVALVSSTEVPIIVQMPE